MGKIVGKITGILSIFMLGIFLSFQTPVALAQEDPKDTCEIETNPKQGKLNDTDNSVTFTIDLGYNPTTSHQVETRCGPLLGTGRARTRPATPIPGTTKISAFLENGRGNCNFSIDVHEIWVKSGNFYPCRAAYEVVNSDTLCTLELDANDQKKLVKDLEPGLRVTGSKLTNSRQFELFFDNQKIKRKWSGDSPQNNFDLHTPSFPEKPELPVYIPDFYLNKPGKHRIDIRRRYIHAPGPFMVDNGPALCPLDFIVESPDKPVTVLDTTGLKECKSGPNCSSGASQECTGGTKPSVKTAIGCIHTNPGDLIADVLKFALGIGGGLAFLMMLLGAFQMLTSAGNPETLQAGKDRLTSAVIGLLFIIFSVLLLQIIGVDILGILK